MNDIQFFTNFRFNEFHWNNIHHVDNSTGVPDHYLGYMKQGRGLIVGMGEKLEISENEMFYIPKGYKYHSYWTGKEVILDSLGFKYFPSYTQNGYVLQKLNYTDEIYKFFLPLSQNKTVNNMAVGRLYTLLGMLEPIMKKSPETQCETIVQWAIELMNKNHLKTIPEYAKMCNVSPSLLYNYFKKVTKKPPNQIRQEVACSKATQLLVSTDMEIEKICELTGFSSPAYFRKVMHGVYGKSPSKIRKEAKII